MERPLLERARELAELAAAAREAAGGAGTVALVIGEAGIGKSSLVQAMRQVVPAQCRFLVGYCDQLATPRVLGPLRDLAGGGGAGAGVVGAALAAALDAGDRDGVFDALRAELDRRPTVLVVEDAHWADEATLDVLTLLVHRLPAVPVLLVLTYRTGEIGRDHPLRRLLGLVATVPGMRQLRLARLSAGAVRLLGAGTGVDPEQLYAVTAGNPFFVAEVLASGDAGAVPPTVAKVVRARLGRLDAATHEAVEQLAVVPHPVRRWLVEALVPGGLAALAAAERSGMLAVTTDVVAFGHELTRRAVVESMTVARRVACDRAVLAALLSRPAEVDASSVLHHAAEVGDREVVIRYGPAAARAAAAAGSHREAVAHYRLVLAHAGALAPAERAELLEGLAAESYTIGLEEHPVRAQEEAVRLRRELGDPRALGASLRLLSRIAWWAGARASAQAAGAEAVDVLRAAGDRPGLMLALANQAQLLALAGRTAESIAVGERVVAMSRAAGDTAVLAHALNYLGLAYWHHDPARGRATLETSLAAALAAGDAEQYCRASVNLCWNLVDDLLLDDAERVLGDAVELAERAELLGFLRYLRLERGLILLARGAWAEAEQAVTWAVDAQPALRSAALAVLGRARVRRGLAGGEALLAEAAQAARRLGEPQHIGLATAALAEAAWLRGGVAALAAALPTTVAPHHEDVRRHGRRSCAAELAYWLHVAGHPAGPGGAVGPNTPNGPGPDGREESSHPEHPYALRAAGRWREAAAWWERAGCPYERAAALADSTEADDLLTALAILDSLDAQPLARHVRARLRDLGVARVPRGPAPATRGNPARLTSRQVEVVRLLAEGLTNAEIAGRLVLSVRTVDSHVAAILDKLGACTRGDAAARARDLGMLGA